MYSPSKRRRLIPSATIFFPETEPSSQELWKWTLTQDAIAPCRVRDVFAMKDNGGKGESTVLCVVT